MSRNRKKHRGLPRRVYVKGGVYYYYPAIPMRDPADGKFKTWIRLARVDEGESRMLSVLALLIQDRSQNTGSMPHLCTEFRINRLDRYSSDTRATYAQYLSVIADDFEQFQVDEVTTKDWAAFLRNHYLDKANTARKITALGVRLFRYAISEFGLRADNPLEQVDLSNYRTKRREILPTHEQVKAIRDAGKVGADGRVTRSGPMLECLIDMTYLCWQRAIDVRTMTEAQITLNEGGLVGGRISLKPSKTARSSGLAVQLVITPAIADVIERARAIKRRYNIVSGFLFPATAGRAAGKPYAKTGLCSMWDRARERAKIAEGIQFKDLRALGATDAARRGENKKAIQNRLVHTTEGTTDIYIKDSVPAVSEIDLPLPWKTF